MTPPDPPRSPHLRTPRVAVVCARFNASVTDLLLEGALRAHRARLSTDPAVVRVPGVVELTPVCAAALRTGAFDAVVALACVVRGQTRHDEVIADAAAIALANLSAELARPISFGVLTVATPDQAHARAAPNADPSAGKGAHAMDAALDTLDAIAAVSDRRSLLETHPAPDKAAAHAGPRDG